MTIQIYSIIGWHPTEAGSYTKEIENKLQEQLTLPKVVALGNWLGLSLDGRPERSPR